MVVVGSDYTDVAGPTELTFNARVAANLGAPVLLVVSAFERKADDVAQVVEIATAELVQAHAATVGVLANRCAPTELVAIRDRLSELGLPTWALPEMPLLSAPLVADLMTVLDGEMLFGDEAMLHREAEHMLVCGMNVEHVLVRTARRPALHRSRRSSGGARGARGRSCRGGLPFIGGHRPKRWLPTG